MFGKKGQGTLEYLLILAGVLGIAVVVISVVHNISTQTSTSATLKIDEYNCAQKGIPLTNNKPVEVNNKECTHLTSDSTVDLSKLVSCKISSGATVYYNTSGGNCYYK